MKIFNNDELSRFAVLKMLFNTDNKHDGMMQHHVMEIFRIDLLFS